MQFEVNDECNNENKNKANWISAKAQYFITITAEGRMKGKRTRGRQRK